MSENYEDYLEGNYDGNIIQRYKQMKDDEQETIPIVEEIKKKQEEVKEREKERISGQYGVTGTELDELFKAYAEEDKFGEYLVDGAILKCNQATKEGFSMPDGKEIILAEQGNEEECCHIILHVTENPISTNGLAYATVKDTVLYKNIIPPKCNCKLAADRNEEVDKIMADQERNKNGVCRHLMKLNEEWDNMVTDGTGYLKKVNVEASLLTAGVTDILANFGNREEVEGITMTSMLFCKHGGLITPVTSGQRVMTRARAMIILNNYLSTGKIYEFEAENALLYLAEQSSYKLAEYKSSLGFDYNKYDDYILGWTEYYNEFSNIKIDPNYIKAQCYQESRIGNQYKNTQVIPAENLERDIMQALDVRNYNIYEYVGISLENFNIITKEGNYVTGSEIWKLNLGAIGYPEPKANEYNEGKKERCGGIIENLFNQEIDGTGYCYYEGSEESYYYQLEAVTPIMSIGIGMDKMRELLDNHAGDYYEALKEYNGSSNKESYANTIIGWVQSGKESLNME